MFNNSSVDLHELCAYDEKHLSHSKQFRSTIAEENCYWSRIKLDMELPTLSQNNGVIP